MFGYRVAYDKSSIYKFYDTFSIVENENNYYCSYRRFPYHPDNDRTGKEIAECPKIKIESGKETVIRITASQIELNNFWDYFIKFVPGILFLAPFTNYGYYYHRDYEINIITQDIR